MVEMELSKIVIDEKRHDQLIVLKEKNGDRLLPIVIGLSEVLAIRSKISGDKSVRPMTHDLLYSLITSLDSTLDRILIDRLEENIFYAKLIVRMPTGKTAVIDARPSDSIALAVRAKVSVFVEEDVIKQTQTFK